MEQLIKIPTSDKKQIYGKLRGSLKQPLVVFVHGLGDLMDQHIYYNGSRFLEKHSISSFRFNLYGWEKDARNLSECTLETHSYDFDRVVTYLRKRGVKIIFAVGHSFGGSSILFSKRKDIDGLVLWDSSYDLPRSFDDMKYVKPLDMYLVRWNMDILLGKAMVEGVRRGIKKEEEKKIKEFHVPVKIITAGRGVLIKGGQRYYELANKPKSYVMIKKASHTFDEDGIAEQLFQETLSWVKRFT